MAISVSNTDSLYSQVIQSAQNRRRVNEQSGQTQDPASRQKNDLRSTVTSDNKKVASADDYQKAYESARESLRLNNATSPKTAAYANVQQFSSRDQLENMLSFSAYA